MDKTEYARDMDDRMLTAQKRLHDLVHDIEVVLSIGDIEERAKAVRYWRDFMHARLDTADLMLGQAAQHALSVLRED